MFKRRHETPASAKELTIAPAKTEGHGFFKHLWKEVGFQEAAPNIIQEEPPVDPAIAAIPVEGLKQVLDASAEH